MNLKRLTEISPIIGAYLIFIGFFKLYIFYNHWDIKISSYLDLSEILLSFLNDINIILFFLVIMFLQAVIGVSTIVVIDKKIAKDTNSQPIAPVSQPTNLEITSQEERKMGIMDSIDQLFTKNKYAPLIILTCSTLLFTLLLFIFSNIIFLYLIFISFLQLVLVFSDLILEVKNHNTLLQVSFVLVLFGFSFFDAKYQTMEIEKSPIRYELYFENNEVIKTDSKLVYLGKTNNYFFLYNNPEKKSIIFPVSTLKKVIQLN